MNNIPRQERSFFLIIEVHSNKIPIIVNKRPPNPSLARQKEQHTRVTHRYRLIDVVIAYVSIATVITFWQVRGTGEVHKKYLGDFTGGDTKFFAIKFALFANQHLPLNSH